MIEVGVRGVALEREELARVAVEQGGDVEPPPEAGHDGDVEVPGAVDLPGLQDVP